MINYDRNGAPPQPSQENVERAIQAGSTPIGIECQDENSEFICDFIAFVSHIPRIDEIIYMKDGTKFRVYHITHHVSENSDLITTNITVFAKKAG